MRLHIYEGKIGHEDFLCTVDIDDKMLVPRKGEKICLDKEIYTVIDVLNNYDINEVEIFVKLYDWE